MTTDFSSRPHPSRSRTLDATILAAGVLAFALAAWAAWTAWHAARSAQAQVEEARREAADAEARARALDAPGVGEEGLALRALQTLQAPPPRVVADLAGLMPRDVRLESFTITYGARMELSVQVAARTARAYDVFLRSLTESPRFTAVLPGDEAREGEVRSSVTAVYLGVAP